VTTDPQTAARYEPIAHDVDVEAELAKAIALRGVLIGPLVVAVAGVFGGRDAAFAALIGVLVVVVNFLASGFLMSRAARVSLALYHAAALFGFFIRLGLITATMLLVAQVIEIDRLAMGVAAVVSYLTLLVIETVAVSRGKKKELEWT
jgi:hypothetical protein